MGKYNFDKVYSRENTSSVKYDLRKVIFGNENVLPMWVADMDIPTPDFIIDALNNRLTHHVLGYTIRDKEYNKAIAYWQKEKHGWEIMPGWIDFCPGVVAGLNHVITAFTNPGDKIVIQPPVYHPFFHTVTNNERLLIFNPLKETNGYYTIDFIDLEQKLKLGAKMLILSNPHNPVGRVWKKEELVELGNLCLKYNVLVVSDEIHSDLIFKPSKHQPFAAISNEFLNNSITLSSPSKTFNTAGLASGYVIIPNDDLHNKYKKSLEKTGAGLGNIFGFEALKASYSPQGEEWLQEVLNYLQGNINLVSDFIIKNKLAIRFIQPEGTYLLWLNFRELGVSDDDLNNLLINTARLGLNQGNQFGKEGIGFQRMNIACSRATVEEALNRLDKALKKFRT